MSADDPTDDELERDVAPARVNRELTDDELENEAKGDRPLSMGGSRGHAPRLSKQSRAINPRAQLEAEGHSMSRQSSHDAMPEGLDRPYDVRGVGGPNRHTGTTADYDRTPPRRTLLGGRKQPEPVRPEASALERLAAIDLAWDRYAAAAMGAIMALYDGAPAEDIAATAAELADKLLEERRRRFG